MQFAESGRNPMVRVRVESEYACLESESESRCEGLESESESSKIGTRVRLESKDESPSLGNYKSIIVNGDKFSDESPDSSVYM